MANGASTKPLSNNRAVTPAVLHQIIPDEILFLILETLDKDDLYNTASVCKQLHYLVLPVYLSRMGISPLQGQLTLFNIFAEDATVAIHRALFKPSLNRLSCTFDLCKPAAELQHDFETVLHLLDKLAGVREVYLEFGHPRHQTRSDIQLQERTKLADEDFIRALQRQAHEFKEVFDAVLKAGCKSFIVTVQCASPAHDVEQAVIQESRKFLPFWKFFSNGRWHLPANPELEVFQVHASMLFHPLLCHWTFTTLNLPSLTRLSFDQLGHLSPRTWTFLLPSITLPNLSKLSINLCLVPTFDLYRFLARHATITELYLGPTLLPPDQGVSFPRGALKSLRILTTSTSYLTSLLSSRANPFCALSHVYVLHRVQRSSHFALGSVNQALEFVSPRLRSMDQVRFSLLLETGDASWLASTVQMQAVPNSPTTFTSSCVTRVELKVCLFRLHPSLTLALPTWLSKFRRMTHFVLFTMSPESDPFEEEYRGVFFRSTTMKCPDLEVIQVNDKVYDVESFGRF